MPGNTRPTTDERDNLLTYLAQQRHVLKITAFGLTDEQAREVPTKSSLSVGGVIKHVSLTESGWMDTVLQRRSAATAGDYSGYLDGFTLRPDETLAEVIARYDEVAAETDAIVAGIADLGQPVPVPQGVPWFPKDVEAWSVRWVLGHLITETARHAGHADIVREHVDGASAYPLMAAAEDWPDTPWMPKWTRTEPV